MDAPNFHMKELVVAAMEHAASLAAGTVSKAAVVVFTLILGMYLRLILVLTLLAGYRQIVVGLGISLATRRAGAPSTSTL
jgi:hypothetical protein